MAIKSATDFVKEAKQHIENLTPVQVREELETATTTVKRNLSQQGVAPKSSALTVVVQKHTRPNIVCPNR